MITAPLVDIVNGTSFIAMRSIISKLVPPDELGNHTRAVFLGGGEGKGKIINRDI